jgi:hypothetical protein
MKIIVTNYTFDKTAKTVTFTDYGSISLDHILLITNVTRNIVIYNFADSTKGGTVATNVLTLTFDTSAQANTDKLQIFYDDTTATQAISASSLPLPTGAATGAKQDTGNTSLASIDGKITAVNTGAVVVSSSALPSGASTSAKQDTGNTSLASIDGKITAVNTGAVVVSSSALPTGGSTSAKQDTGNTSVASIDTKTPALGQALAAASVPVVLTAAQITTLTPPAAIAGFALDATLTGGTQKAKITDGTNDATVKAASTAAGATDKALVVAISPNNTIPVSGTFWQVTQPISGTVTTTPPSNASTNISQINGHTTLEGGANGSQAVGGTVATNVAITANPINLGAQAVSSENTAVTTARQVQLVADLVGKLIVLPYANPENFVSGAITSAMTGTTSTSLVAAPAAGLRNYITQITVSNSHATVGTDVIIQDGSGGTTLYTIPAAAVYGGAVVPFPTPLRQPTTATAIFCANVTTGASTKVSASGYKGV